MKNNFKGLWNHINDIPEKQEDTKINKSHIDALLNSAVLPENEKPIIYVGKGKQGEKIKTLGDYILFYTK